MNILPINSTPELKRQKHAIIARLRAGLALLLLVLGLAPQTAQAVYVNRYSITTNGAITFTGNTLGLDGNGSTVGTPGTSGSIGAFTTTNTGVQTGTYPAGTTANWALNSSMANLTIPGGSTVLYAELIWGGSYAYGGADISASIGNAITFTTPSGTYSVAPTGATSQTLGVAGAGGTCATAPCRYVRSANVTGLVQLGGAGAYVVGGVPATANAEANNNVAGWTLAVVYGNAGLPPRNMNVFVGAEAGGNAPTGVSGFCTNLVGSVKGRLLVSAMEGDASISGDQMRFGPTTGSMVTLSGPNNANGNFFGGQLNGDLGSLDTSGTFGSTNHNPLASATTSGARQGYDITNVDVSSAMSNNQTAAVAQGTTTTDQYTINALAIQIDVGSPKFPLTVKTANRTVTAVGDIVTYTITLDNTLGTANATNVNFTDVIPPGMSFRSGTVLVNSVAQPSFNPVTGFSMGTINAGSVGTVSFQANVDALPASPAPAQFVNRARWTYDFISCAGFPVERGSVETNANTLPAVRLAPTKTVSPTGAVGIGTTLTYTTTVPNTGATNSGGTTLTDAIPAGTSYVAGSTTLNGAVVPDSAGAMPFASGAAINSPTRAAGVIATGETATIVFRVTVNAGAPAVITNSAAIDPDGAGPAGAIIVAATNTPLTPPVAVKSFAPGTVSLGQASTLTIQLSNANATALSVVALSDTLPAGLVIANPANALTNCGAGSALATPAGITLGLSNGSVPASGSCTISASVVGTAAGNFLNTIPASAVSSLNAGSSTAPTNATLRVLQGPSLSKAFSPATIAPGGVSTLTITLTNPTASALTAAGFTDNLPPGVLVAATPAASTTCGGGLSANPNAISISLSAASIPAANVCTVQVNVSAAAVGIYSNILPPASLSTSGGGNVNPAEADLTVSAPLISKSFAPNPVGANVNSVLTITLTNPTNTLITGATFTDLFPSTPGAMTLTNTTTSNTCGGALTSNTGSALAVGSAGIRLTSGSIAAVSTCTITVNVRAATGGNYLNSIAVGALVTTNGGSNTIAANATLSVGLPGVQKAFGTIATPLTTVAAGAPFPLAIGVSNPNAVVLPLTSLTDAFPSGMTLANTTVSNGCGGSVSNDTGGALAIGAGGIRINAGSIPASSSCTISVNVQAASAGSFTNTIAVGAVVTPTGNNAFASSATITVLGAPTLAKSFGPASISPTGTSLLTLTLSNPNAQTLTGAAFTDVFPISPGAMTLANTTTTNTCGGTLTDSSGGSITLGDVGLRLSGGSIPGGGSCAITTTVTASAIGSYTNTIAAAALTTANGGSNTAPASALLNISILPPGISKVFGTNPIGRNGVTRLTFTLTNPNTATALNGVQFTDTFPTLPGAMTVAASPNATLSGCGTALFAPTALATGVTMTGASIPAASTCTAAVDVTAPAVGIYSNVSSAVVSSNGGTGGTASNTLRVLSPPSVAKSFSVNPVNVGATTVLTVTVSNPNAADVLNGVAVNDLYPAMGGLLNTTSPSPTVNCSSGSSATATGGAAATNTIGLSSGILAPGGFCSVSVNVAASSAASIANVTSVVTSSSAGNGTTASSTLIVGVGISGFVYADGNANASKDGVEAGTGLTLYAKLLSGGVVQQSVAINPASGAYSFAAFANGSYTVILDDNNTAADTIPNVPAPWFGTENPAYSKAVTLSGSNLVNQNFGLNNGTSISGRVFRDNGALTGTANDGLFNGTEIGLAGVTVRLTDCASATLATATTDGSGLYSLPIPPATLNGANLCVVETNPGGFLSTGSSPGSTAGAAAGAYNRNNDTVSFVHAIGTSHSNINFGDVAVNTFSTDGIQTVLPGSGHFFAHTFVAQSAGQVSFSSSALATPTFAGWSEVIYRDSNCSGGIDAGEPVLSAPLAVLAGDTVCVLLKQFAPAAAPFGAQNQVTITASFTYTNATPSLSAIYLHTDTTTVGTPTSAGLTLTKSVDRPTAWPGDTIIYTITYRNDSTGTLTNLVINDSTPAFTIFVTAACAANPANITGCSVTTQPAVNGTGALVWTLSGGLLSGASSSVSFSVKVVP